jgi:type IV conjugative transfer system protein TraL
MDEHQRRLLIPRRVDDPLRFFLWDADVALVFIAFIGVGMIMDAPLVSLGLGAGSAWAYSKLKGGAKRGFGLHALYWYVGLSLGKRTPKSSQRHFVG